jgi:hypothetical protein
MQWHPIFAQLLRPLVQDYYEVSTDLPVGDLPRQADIVLLRRTAPAPFVGIWRHLSTWNVLEFKGPSDDPALRDLDSLLEVGLGIDRKLNEERRQQGQALLERAEVSWWYLANHLGQRFRAEAQRVLGGAPEALGEGLWRCPALGRMLYLVSRDGLPVDRESVPLHLVTEEPLERVQALARELVRQPGFWETYGGWLAQLHPNFWQELQQMIREMGTEPNLDLRRVIDLVGLKQVIDQVGLKQVIDQVGLQRVLETVEPGQVIAVMGLDWYLAQLTPEQLQELKRRLP